MVFASINLGAVPVVMASAASTCIGSPKCKKGGGTPAPLVGGRIVEMRLSRRTLLQAASAAAGAAILAPTCGSVMALPNDRLARDAFAPAEGARSRVLIINDLCGDIDGLFATTHALLSRSTSVCGIVGSRARPAANFPTRTPERSVELADEILRLMGLTGAVPTFAGGAPLSSLTVPVKSAGAQAIIDEGMRADTTLPLFVTVGAGLSEVASALLIEPRLADRLTLVWIGGHALPSGRAAENNFNIDPLAAQVVFNQSAVPIWQVPSDAYRTCIISATELQAYVAPYGAIGAWLYRKLLEDPRKLIPDKVTFGETYRLGDGALVLLTALSDLRPVSHAPALTDQRTSSSSFQETVAPRFNVDGTYTSPEVGRKIRVYTSLDTRMMFSDFFAKMRVNFGVESVDIRGHFSKSRRPLVPAASSR